MSDVSDVYFPINYKVLNLINYFRLFHIHIAIKSISYLGSHPEMFCKLQFLKISQNSLENTCARVFFIKVLGMVCNFMKRKLQHRWFRVNFAEFSITLIFKTSANCCFRVFSTGQNKIVRLFLFLLQKSMLQFALPVFP